MAVTKDDIVARINEVGFTKKQPGAQPGHRQ